MTTTVPTPARTTAGHAARRSTARTPLPALLALRPRFSWHRRGRARASAGGRVGADDTGCVDGTPRVAATASHDPAPDAVGRGEGPAPTPLGPSAPVDVPRTPRARFAGHAGSRDPERGMATAEYAIATVAAAGFAGLLVVILRSGEVRELLLGIIRSALSL